MALTRRGVLLGAGGVGAAVVGTLGTFGRLFGSGRRNRPPAGSLIVRNDDERERVAVGRAVRTDGEREYEFDVTVPAGGTVTEERLVEEIGRYEFRAGLAGVDGEPAVHRASFWSDDDGDGIVGPRVRFTIRSATDYSLSGGDDHSD